MVVCFLQVAFGGRNTRTYFFGHKTESMHPKEHTGYHDQVKQIMLAVGGYTSEHSSAEPNAKKRVCGKISSHESALSMSNLLCLHQRSDFLWCLC